MMSVFAPLSTQHHTCRLTLTINSNAQIIEQQQTQSSLLQTDANYCRARGASNRIMPRNELHALLFDKPTVGIEEVRALINKYPNAVKERDVAEAMPLHYAVRYGASLEVIKLLIKEYPEAARVKDNIKCLPLHYAANSGNDVIVKVEVAQLLIKAYPDSVKEKDVGGNLPLHWAARLGKSVEVIQLLIEAYPDAVKVKDGEGSLPLHYAIQGNASDKVIELFIKAYPDAAKEKDKNGYLPLSHPDFKETYDRVITGIPSSPGPSHVGRRSKGLLGDHAEGEDLLGVKEEAQAIADTIAFKDLTTPFVVGILGGWGSGKSFAFNIIKEYLKEIQGYDLTKKAVKHDFPYVGHIYPIEFDVWTYAKGILWAGLMNRILTALNDQLSLEAEVGFELLMKGVSVIELMDQFTSSGEIKYLKEAIKDESVQKALREWKPSDGKITKALIDATNSNYEKEVKDLAEKQQQLDNFTSKFEKQKDKKKQELAWKDVIAGKSTEILPEIQKILKDAYNQYAAEKPGDPVPQTVEAALENLKRWKGIFGPSWRFLDILRAGRLSPLWATVFLSSLIIAVVLPLVLDKVGAAFTALGPFASGIFVKFNDARERLNSVQDVIIKSASKMNLDKEQLQEAMEEANRAQRGSDTNDEEKQQDNIAMLNAEINTLKDRIWLREGDSLNKVVRDRLGSSNYEEHLGVVHQAQADLKLISDAMLNEYKVNQIRYLRY